MESVDDIAACCSALSHVSRVEIFKLLLRRGAVGLSTGELQAESGLPASTLAFHLREMDKGGILDRRAEGRQTIVTLRLDQLMSMAQTLMNLCCADLTADVESERVTNASD